MAPPNSHLYFDLLVHSTPRTSQIRNSHQQTPRASLSSIVSTLINMDKRFSTSSSPGSIQQLRDILAPGKEKKDRISPALKEALQLLQFRGLEGLENHFLATEAFLKPWSQFRDTFFLLQPNDRPRASLPGQIKGMDILWFYTNFLEGELRYDARCDDTTSLYTADETKYGTFDKSHWGVQDHEKMMYAWLLQEFCVGKGRNPFGIQYFQFRNVCLAWEEVFVPVVDAVRESYDVRGRRYYGRLATFIEERCPSRLAFPEGNVPEPMSATPFRWITRLRERETGEDAELERPITKNEYNEVEKELRNVYPKYGQVVERPRFKTRMEDWLAAQKTRALHKRHLKDVHGRKSPSFGRRKGRESPMFGCKGIDSSSGSVGARRSVSMASLSSAGRTPTSAVPPLTPTSQKSKTKKEARVPYGMFGYVPRPKKPDASSSPSEPRSPLQTMSLQKELPKTPDDPDGSQSLDDLSMNDADCIDDDELYAQPIKTVLLKPSFQRQGSDGVYTSIRNSNPFTDHIPIVLGSVHDRNHRKFEDEVSPMVPPSAIPKPLFTTTERQFSGTVADKSSPTWPGIESDIRQPSYEGTGYERDITPTFIARKMHTTLEHDASQQTSQGIHPSEFPGTIHPAHRDQHAFSQTRAHDIPRSVPWPGQIDTPGLLAQQVKRAPWPNNELPPPIPSRNPARINSMRNLHSHNSGREPLQPPPKLPTLGPRIISKENIRAHLSVSREGSEEDLRKVDDDDVHSIASTSASRPLKTFNSHMFPRQDRKGTPVGAWLDRAREDVGGDVEMEMLEQKAKI